MLTETHNKLLNRARGLRRAVFAVRSEQESNVSWRRRSGTKPEKRENEFSGKGLTPTYIYITPVSERKDKDADSKLKKEGCAEKAL